MSLIHDLVEIDAGDVAAWDTSGRKRVEHDEYDAIAKIHQMLENSEGEELEKLWIEHEELKTIEAKLVKACDQICPLIYRVVFKSGYAGTGVDREKLDEILLKYVDFSETTKDLYYALTEEIAVLGLFDLRTDENIQ
ncbi:HD domain-containing protein [Candidatus Dojkabacteria bacterium]|uniref:HD domain-containing protein n=1 Tax=Candidatus Dojkabacteria bacterium TaxID=2099670 RepID=A0A955RKW6_9BACT|nr:HD domain-containing protein [Candidatus Dojkabacteria bacterium]